MTIRQIQLLLAYLGYYAGELDGKWGQQSRSACTRFQQDCALDADGIAGSVTQQALKAAVAGTACDGSSDGTGKTGTESTGETGTFWGSIRYFRRAEFACQCGGKYCNGFPCEMAEETVRMLDEIRERAGVPICISSGLRCPTHNEEVGGVSSSRHMAGQAADMVCSLAPEDLYQIAVEVAGEKIPGRGGIGLYPWGVHIDNGPYSRWNG